MKTIGIDTNVLLSLRLQRGEQSAKAQSLFKDCLAGKVKVFLPDIVFVETEWVLRSYYKQPKSKICEFLEELLQIEYVLMPDKNIYRLALEAFRNTNFDLIDCVVVTHVQSAQTDEFLTFDEQLQTFYQANTPVS